MPVNFGLWRVDGETVVKVEPASLSAEDRLEDFIEGRIDILGLGDLLIVGRQVITEFGKRIDLLAIDALGDLYVLELKKDRTPREVVAQVLEYGFWIGDLSYEDITELYAIHHGGEDFASGFSSHFETDVPETVNAAHRLIVVASRMDQSTEQIVTYLGRYDVPINVLFFEYLVDGEREYLARTWLADPEHSARGGGGATKKQPPWNGTDFFVAIGENEHRNWDDMRRYGFVSAGHGEKYRRAMGNLSTSTSTALWSEWAGGRSYACSATVHTYAEWPLTLRLTLRSRIAGNLDWNPVRPTAASPSSASE